MVVLPVLVIVTLAPKPPDHWLVTMYCTEQPAQGRCWRWRWGWVVGVGVGEVGVGVGVVLAWRLLLGRISMPLTLALSLTLVNWIVICPWHLPSP